MADIEKTIKGLDTCIKHIDHECPIDCPYYEKCTKYEGRVVFQPLLRDTLTLLKQQKAVEPILEQDFMVCGVCGHEVIWQKMLGDGIWSDEKLDYCPHCGQKVKWNE